MAVNVTTFKSQGDGALDNLNAQAENIDSVIGDHEAALERITDAVRRDDMTGKKAQEAKALQNEAFVKNLFAHLDEAERHYAAVNAYCDGVSDPPDPIETAKARSAELVDVTVRNILKQCEPEPNGSFAGPGKEDAVLLTNWLLGGQLAALNSNLRQTQVRDDLLALKGGVMRVPDPSGHGFASKVLGPYEHRLHLYKQALAAGDADTIAVFENPAHEWAFYYDENDRSRKVWAGFMAAKSAALESRKDPEQERAKGAASALRDQANKAQFLIGDKIQKLINREALTLSDDVQFQRISGLLNTKVNIGGKRFGHTWNPFQVRRKMAKRGG